MPFLFDDTEFDLATNVTSNSQGMIPSGQQPTLDPASVAQGPGPLDYYVSFSGISIDGQSEFALSDFSLGGSQGTDKAELSPLDLTFADSAIEPKLLALLTLDKHIVTARVYGYTAGTDTVAASYGFTELTVDTLDTSNGSVSAGLTYGTIADASLVVGSDGTITQQAGTSYAVNSNVTGGSGAPIPSSATLDPASVAQGPGPLDYYVSFSGISIDGQSEFALSDFSLGGSQGTDKAELSPLDLTFADSAIEPKLLALLTLDKHIVTAKVYGYTAGTDTVAASYGFTELTVDTLDTSNGSVSAGLTYGTIADAFLAVGSDGTITQQAGTSYAVNSNVTGGSGAPIPSSATLDPASVAQGPGPLDYYVSFSGISIDGQSEFALSDFSLGGSQGTDKAELSPLDLTFADSAIEPKLLALLTLDKHIVTAKVYGYTAGTDTVAASYGFTELTVDTLDTSNGSVSAGLTYGTIADASLVVGSDGTITQQAGTSYAVNSNVTGGSGAPIPSSATLDPASVAQGPGPLDYYVSFSGISIDGQSEFALSDFSLGGSQGTDKAELSPLDLTFADSAIEPKLLALLTLDKHIVTAKVYGYTAGTDTVAASYGFTELTVDTLDTSNGSVSAELDYTSIGDGSYTNVACFCPGTAIRTPEGDVAVEALAIGDRVSLANGEVETIRWIGRRSYAGRFLAGRPQLMPVRIGAGALGDGLPLRDLVVSRCHALFLDGFLVPAEQLVNGCTIVQEGGLDRVDYLHVELDRHAIIVAEGAPTESFVDDGGRAMFQNAGEGAALYPSRAWKPPVYCAPRVESGFELETIRKQIALSLAA